MTPAAREMDGILQTMEAAGKVEWDRFDVARFGNCSVEHACYLIWDHGRSQHNLRPSNRPDMTFHRMAGYRTRSARYRTGTEVIDVKDIAHSLADDLLVKFQRGTDKDIRAVIDANPAVAAAFSQQLHLLEMQVNVTVQTLAAL